MGLGIKTKLFQTGHYVFKNRIPAWRALFCDVSEHGETSLLRRLTRGKCDGMLVDVGANNGVTHSNSLGLIRDGWSAVLIEPHPVAFDKPRALHIGNSRVSLVNSACANEAGTMQLFIGKDGDSAQYATLSKDNSDWFQRTRTDDFVEVAVAPLTQILTDARCPSGFDLLSIDTEGFDLVVLQSLDFSLFRPDYILTEDDPTLHPPPEEQRTDAKKYALLEESGYHLIRRFCRNSLWAGGKSV